MEKNFNIAPTVSIGRSKFIRQNAHKTSFNLGDIVPIYIDEVLPGDTMSIDVASLVRMSTPIAPIMDDIVLEFFAFFVPNRLVWDNWKYFMGESKTAGYDTGTTYTVPMVRVPINSTASSTIGIPAGSIGDYLGLPYIEYQSGLTAPKCSVLPLRGYALIYNRWFRNQNVEPEVVIPHGDIAGNIIVNGDNSHPLTYTSGCLKAYKKADYFTSALPYAQKGEAVTIPLSGYAPIIAQSTEYSVSNHQVVKFKDVDSGTSVTGAGDVWLDNSGLSYISDEDMSGNSDGQIAPSNLYANLSAAVGATVNQLRLSFAVQKLLEKDALYGSRYWEVIYGHFGTKSPDATMQDPEYLGGAKTYINVDQVLQTTGYAGGDTSELGSVGANSVTGSKHSLFTKSFVEHGHVFIMAVARQVKHTYGQGLNRMFSREKRFDFYWPVFANLGAQELKLKELYCNSTQPEKTFGFQEFGAEYRWKPNITSGVLNPSRANSLDYWTLAEDFADAPTLSRSFLLESRDNIKRALVTGENGPDFIGDFLFTNTAVRPMPMYSIPGLIDHH